MGPVLIVKYRLVRPQGIWPASIRHHLIINKQLPDILIYHRFVDPILHFVPFPIHGFQRYRAIQFGFASWGAADDDGIALIAMLVCDGHVFVITARLNEALITRLFEVVHAVLDLVLRAIDVECFGRNLYSNYSSNTQQ